MPKANKPMRQQEGCPASPKDAKAPIRSPLQNLANLWDAGRMIRDQREITALTVLEISYPNPPHDFSHPPLQMTEEAYLIKAECLHI